MRVPALGARPSGLWAPGALGAASSSASSGGGGGTPFSPAPSSYWKLDTVTATSTPDAVGSNDLTWPSGIVSPVLIAPLVAGSAVNLARLSTIVSAPAGVISHASDWSISFWFMTHTVATFYPTIMEKDSPGSDFTFLKNHADDHLNFYFGGGGSPADLGGLGNGVLCHAGFSWAKTTSTFKLYRNGAPSATVTSPGPTDSERLLFGSGNPAFGDRRSDIDFDEIAIWQSVLSDAKFAELYTRGIAGMAIIP